MYFLNMKKKNKPIVLLKSNDGYTRNVKDVI
jgi:hypothetical protein